LSSNIMCLAAFEKRIIEQKSGLLIALM
jgi:hypothetical protein